MARGKAQMSETKYDELMRDPEVRELFLKEVYADHAAEVSELKEQLAEARELLGAYYQLTGIICNGYCAVCKIGYRKWKLPKCKTPDGPCSNTECLSRRTDAFLEKRRTGE
jgi:hypothetical protein